MDDRSAEWIEWAKKKAEWFDPTIYLFPCSNIHHVVMLALIKMIILQACLKQTITSILYKTN